MTITTEILRVIKFGPAPNKGESTIIITEDTGGVLRIGDLMKMFKNLKLKDNYSNQTILWYLWRRHPESNQGITDLQSAALPLGHAAIKINFDTVSLFIIGCSLNDIELSGALTEVMWRHFYSCATISPAHKYFRHHIFVSKTIDSPMMAVHHSFVNLSVCPFGEKIQSFWREDYYQ
jgi:hypothetical protein